MQQDRDRLKRYSTRILFGGRHGGHIMTNIYVSEKYTVIGCQL